MPNDLLHKDLRQLLSAGQTRGAAEHLCAYLEGEAANLYSSSLQLLSRINRLEYRIAENKIDAVESDFEKAQINKAILELASQSLNKEHHSNLFPFNNNKDNSAQNKVRKISRTPFIGFVLLIILAWLTYFTYRLGYPSPFDLKVSAFSKIDGTAQPIKNGKLKIILDDYPLQPRTLDDNGEVVFPEIPAEYENASIKLIPVEMRYGLVNQSALTPNKAKAITAEFAILPDTTFLRGTVFSPVGQRAPYAWLSFNNGIAYGFTDEEGRFLIKVPRKAGEEVRLYIEWKGIGRYNERLILPESDPLILNLK